ncbi:MAG: hypothetical protein H0U71_04825 [Gammaproteobacteria bacterium]|nr:hypothetical protein [Gammaproteobacteria bacterium]
MKKDQPSNMFTKTRELPVKAFLIKGASEEDRLKTAHQIISDVTKTNPRFVYGCYGGDDALAVILTRDPSYLWAMSFQEAEERAEADGETIDAGSQLKCV